LIAGINAVATAVILLILGVPFALPLAATVGILGLIPVIGATIGAVVIIVVGLFQSPTTGIILAIYYVVYQQLENNLIQPAIQSKSLGMSPLLILVSVIIGISLAGILGGLLAIPIAGCIKVLIEDYTARHDLNQD
jgi:predicted PurR-regulated permease PerM